MAEEIPENCPGLGTELSGKASACEGCPNQSKCASGEKPAEDPNIQIIADKLSSVKKVILVLSGKGGVGKSTVSSQLAFALAEDENTQIGLLDIDICGPSMPHMVGVSSEQVHSSAAGWSPVYSEEYPNLAVMSIGFMLPGRDEPIIWRGPRKNGLIRQFLADVDWGELDALVIDSPPGTSDEHLSIVTYLSKVQNISVVLVTTPQEVALLDVRKELNFCRKVNINIRGVVENMSSFICPHCNCSSQIFLPSTGGAEKMCQEYQIPLLAQIPIDPKLVAACESGQAILKTSSPVAGVFRELARNILNN